MTYYSTNRRTGEMTPLLEPLRHKPKGKVQHLPSPRLRAHQTTYRPRNYYRRLLPLNDLLLGLGACGSALGFLVATL